MFVTLTRVYKVKGKSGVKTGSISINPELVASVRASNRLGYPEHRSTITMAGGETFDLTEKYTAAKRKLA